jgi:hypothetical protein
MTVRPTGFTTANASDWSPAVGGGGGGAPEPDTETTDAGDGANGLYAITDGRLVLSHGVLDGWAIDKNGLTATVTESSANSNCEIAVTVGGATQRMGVETDAPNNSLLIYKEITDATDFDLKVRLSGNSPSIAEDNFFIGTWRKETNSGLPNYLHKSPSVGVALRSHNTSVGKIMPTAHVARDAGLEFDGIEQYKYTIVHATTRWLRVKRTTLDTGAGLFNIYTQETSVDDPDAGTWVEVDSTYCNIGGNDAPPHNYDICGQGAVIGFAIGGYSGKLVEFFVERIILTYTAAE